MKINISTKEFQDIIKKALNVIPKKHEIEVLENLCVRVQNNNINMIATNLDNYIVFNVDGNITEEGETLLDIETLKLISKLKTDNIIIQDSKIISGNKEIQINDSGNVEEYPEIDFISDCNIHGFTTTEYELAALLTIKYAISEDESRPFLNTLAIDKDCFMTSDSFRIARRSVSFENKIKDRVLMHVDTVNLLDSLINKKGKKNYEVNCFVDEDLKQIVFQIDNMKLYSKLSEEIFPQVEKIIPQDFNTTITTNKKNLLDELEFIKGLKCDPVRLLKFDCMDGEINMTAWGNINKKVKIKLEAEIDNEFGSSFILNHKFVADTIKNSDNGDNVKIKISINAGIINVNDDYILPIKT